MGVATCNQRLKALTATLVSERIFDNMQVPEKDVRLTS